MNILTDDELLDAISNQDIEIDNYNPPENPYTKESPIQPSSLDLTIGEIYVPSSDEISANSATPYDTGRIALKPGHTALVYTHEILKLKDNIGAFGFPPARISGMGLLMTNPGHIDPGYDGKMSFTVINMSRNDITLKPGEPIVTLLVYRMANSVNADYSSRGFPASREPNPKDRLNSLSHDFMDLEKRSRNIAIEEVRNAGVKIKLIGLIALVVVSLIGLFGPWAFYKDTASLSERIKILETHRDMKEFSEKLDQQIEDHKAINNRINELEGSLDSNELDKGEEKDSGY